jgi:hypothetical protein
MKKFPKTALLFLAMAFIAFQVFNFDTTRHALDYLLVSNTILGVSWALALAIGFCVIDLAILVVIISPNPGKLPNEALYLITAWILAITMNALLVWLSVFLVMTANPSLGNEILSQEQLMLVVPLGIALIVWATRILFVGAFSLILNQNYGPNPTYKEIS